MKKKKKTKHDVVLDIKRAVFAMGLFIVLLAMSTTFAGFLQSMFDYYTEKSATKDAIRELCGEALDCTIRFKTDQ